MIVRESLKLNEVGEANLRPYDFYIDDEGAAFQDWIEYKFMTEDRDKYVVNFVKRKDYWIVQYSLSGRGKKLKHEVVVNKGRNYRVMSTVTQIIKHFISQHHPEKMIMSAAKSKDEDKRRLHMYLRYLEKNITTEYTFRTETTPNDDYLIIIEKV